MATIYRGKWTAPEEEAPEAPPEREQQIDQYRYGGANVVDNTSTPVQGFGPSGTYDPRYQGEGNLDKWIQNPPEGYRWTPGIGTYVSPGKMTYRKDRPQETPFISSDQMIDNMHNSEFLTPNERRILNTLPRIMDTQIFGKSLGDRLEGFNEGWLGKTLAVLDVPAEALERSFGFLSQWSDAHLYGTEQDKEEFNRQLSEAWYAGGLFSDMTNIPRFNRDEAGKITGMGVPGKLGGRAGIVGARKRIAELTAQGMDMGDALIQARTEYYNDLGALSIRAQLQDTYQHILLDPLNVVLPYIKPIEATKARSIYALSNKIDDIGDLEKFAKAAEDAGDLADAAKITERIAALKNTPKLNSLDRMAIWLTDSDPLKVPGKYSKFNPFSLSREARAHEMLTTVADNLDAYALSKMTDKDEIMDFIYRLERGALGPEFGHAGLTLEGKMSAAAISAARTNADELYMAAKAVEGESNLLDDIATILGDDVHNVVKQIETGDTAQLVNRLQGTEEGAQVAERITDDFFDIVSTFRKEEVPYTNDLFKLQLSEAVRDSTAQMAIARFGLKERGVIMKASQALKSAETLAFLRLNPTFVAKNWINNEATMIARGLGGMVTEKNLDDFVDLIGFVPHRYGQAFTVAGEQFGLKLGKGEQAIADVLRGEKGMLNKLNDLINKGGDKLAETPFDMGKMASAMESSASKRAFMTGYMQGWNRYFWKPGKGYQTMAKSISPEILNDMPADFVRSLERHISGVMNEAQLRNIPNIENMNRTAAGMADEIINSHGYNLHDRFGSDYVQKLTSQLDEAMPKGPAAVRRVIEEAREETANMLDELADAARAQRVDEIAAVTELSGPNGFLKVFGDAIDDRFGAELAYSMRMSKIDPTGLTGETARLWWTRFQDDTGAFYKRLNDRWDDFVTGAERGIGNIKDANGKAMKLPPQVRKGYTAIRKSYDDFISLRNKSYKTFFDARASGKKPPKDWDVIRVELDEAYAKAAQIETDLTASIDGAITGMIDDPDVSKAYSAWRQRARDLRAEDRALLIEHRNAIEGLSPKAKNEAWQTFWGERQQRQGMMWNNERAGIGIIEKDPKALGAYSQIDEITGASKAQEIRDLAHRYNIPTATKEGIPLDKRLVDTVNKYVRGAYDEAEEVARTGTPFSDLTQQFRAKVDEFIENPRHEIDPAVSSALEDEAYRMLSEVEEGVAGERIFEEGKFARALKSTYPEFYGALPSTRRQTIINALKKIMQDEGADVGVTVERLKQIGLQRLLDGPDADVRVLRAVGRDDQAFQVLHDALQSGKMDDLAGQLGDDIEEVFEWYVQNQARYLDEAGNFKPTQLDFTQESIPGLERADFARKYGNIEDIDPQLAEEAFEARRVFYNEDPPAPIPDKPPQDFPTIADADEVLKGYKATNPEMDIARDQHWLQNGATGLDDIEQTALARLKEPKVSMKDLTPEQTAHVQKYMRQVEGQMADARLASTKFAEFRRDSALLNYNRRYNYNNWLSTIMPFEFWTTQSLAKWALHSIDRPAMLTSYLRMRKLIETAGMPQNGFPSRLKGSMRVNLPFLPDFMGNEFFVDPLRWALPFDNWGSAIDRYRSDQMSIQGRAERLLLDMVQQGKITPEQADEARATRDGPIWNQALSQAQVNDGEGMNDSWDYATMLLSPHAPLMWAKEALIDKTPENIGPFLPISRTIKQAFGALGVDTSQSKYNVGGNIRKELGLPAFDRWDDYRIDRELSNMAAEGYDLRDVKLAMINKSGPLWDEATERAAKGFAGGGPLPFILKALGIPTQSYPEGEEHQRSLQDDFSRAYEAYDGGDIDALTNFFNEYPEYEARLGLWDEPEERLHKFLVDDIWSQYHEMPSVHKRQLREALGEGFENYFLNKDTRNYEAISNEDMQTWLAMMGGDPPGSLNRPVMPIQFADKEEAWRVQQFYDVRRSLYPNFGDQQDVYFKLDDDARKQYRSDNPDLVDYWDWRRDFFHRNPSIVPYLDDDFEFEYPSPEAIPQQTEIPQYTFTEWSYVLGSASTANVLASGDIPAGAEDYLDDIADQLGITLDELVYLVSSAP